MTRLLCLFCSVSSALAEMKVHRQLLDLFEKEPVPTEETAYRVLLKNPVKSDCTYVAIPWVVLINNHQLAKVRVTKVNKGFTVCQHIYFRRIIPLLKKMGVNTLFTPHAEEEEIDGIKIIAFPHVAKNGCLPAKDKDLLYSFVGRQTHECRKRIYKLPPSSDTIIEKIGSSASSTAFKQILARSRFSLCPRGTGPSSIRFWESLQAGAIPIVIADAMTFPSNFDWDTCILKIPESKVSIIPSMTRNISPQRENEMRKACYEAYNLFSKENFVSVIYDYYSNLTTKL